MQNPILTQHNIALSKIELYFIKKYLLKFQFLVIRSGAIFTAAH